MSAAILLACLASVSVLQVDPIVPAAPGSAPEEEAPPGDAEARRLYEQGLALYQTRDYGGAIVLFRAAHERSRAPRLLYNLAQAHRMKGDCREAAELYRRFIQEVPTSEHRPRAEARLREVEVCLEAKARVNEIDGRPPPDRTPPPDPGMLDRAAPVQPVDLGPRAEGSRGWWGGALLGSAMLFGAVGGAFSWRATVASRHTSDLFRAGGEWDQKARANERSGRRAQQAAMLFYLSAAASAGLGAWHYLGRVPSSSPAVSVEVGPGSAGLSWAAGF